MRATGIRSKIKGKTDKVSEFVLEQLCETIVTAQARKGFITQAKVLNSTSIKIGLHMSSFRIDTAKLGANARLGMYVKSPKGYKRTNVPTWDQRVEFNDTVNSIFSKWKLTATIKSGCFTVRDKVRGAHTESDWENQTPTWMGYHGASMNGMGMEVARILTESEAREELDSDRLEAEHREATRAERLEKARLYRRRMKLWNQTSIVIVSGFYSYNNEKTRNGERLTHAQFEKMLSKCSRWERRRVRSASIDVTLNNAPLTLIKGGAA